MGKEASWGDSKGIARAIRRLAVHGLAVSGLAFLGSTSQAGDLSDLEPAEGEVVIPFDKPVRVGFVCQGSQPQICRHPVSGRPTSFSFINLGSPRINPSGEGAHRTYRFEFHQRTWETTRMQIDEQSDDDGRDSHTTMLTSLYLFPRYGLPSAQQVGDRVEVRLSTGEAVCFDAETWEIVGGVLEEGRPIDTNPNRHQRTFADVTYTGSGVLVRTDQRGQSPEKAVVWGAKRRAIITWQGKTCRVPRRLLWHQRTGWFELRFRTNEEVFDFVEARCGWELPELPGPPEPSAICSP